MDYINLAKKTLLPAVRWLITLFTLIFSIAGFVISPITGFVGLLCSFVVAPVTDKYLTAIEHQLGIKIPISHKLIFLVILFFGSIMLTIPSTEPKTTIEDNQASTVQLNAADLTESKNSLQQEKPKEAEYFKVARVIDGDSLELEDGTQIRYLGITAPETTTPDNPIECFVKESIAKNKEILEGKNIKLEKDITDTDMHGRKLRYVYTDNVFVNDYLVSNGYAKSTEHAPDVKYQEQFKQSEALAKVNGTGLWGACKPNIVQTQPIQTTPPVTAPISTAQQPAKTTPTSKYSCNCSKTCTNISSCEEAQYLLNTCGCKARDSDHDGIACDGAPLHCQN